MTAYVGGAGSDQCLVRVCRDCCCGTEAKHPGVDHDGLLTRLEAAVEGHARVMRSGCLLACDESNVVVVTPSPSGRRAGGRPVWVRGVLDDAIVDAVAAWVVRGGPGIGETPGAVVGSTFAPSGLATTWATV